MKSKNIILGALIVGLVSNTLHENKSPFRNRKIDDVYKKFNNDFLEENKYMDGVIETASGLQYKILSQGDENENPKKTDTVTMHYHGTLIDGKVFDSSVDRGRPVSIPLNGVIKGWTEGLQLMTIGSKYKFFIPPELGYGDRDTYGVIPPNSVLIFELELLEFKDRPTE